MGENRCSAIRNAEDSYEDVYIGQHRLSPIRRNPSEEIDAMYDQNNSYNQQSQASFSSTLPPRRVVMPSKYVSSPYDVNIQSFAPNMKQLEYYEAIVRLAKMDAFKQ